MPEVQLGTTSKPIIVIPRIGGLAITQAQIKNDFSNEFVSDALTPLSFVLEYKKREDTVFATVNWSSSKSTETNIFFPMPDSFWENIQEWTVLVAWKIATEKNYTVVNAVFTIKDLHRT